jgi:hypothetical protein
VLELDNTNGTASASVANLIATLRDGAEVVIDDPIAYTNECAELTEADYPMLDELADRRVVEVTRGGKLRDIRIAAAAVTLEEIRFVSLTASPGEAVDLAPCRASRSGLVVVSVVQP